VAETIIVERDIRLVELTGARYHFGQISCRALARCGRRRESARAAHHLRRLRPSSALNELDVGSYYTFRKVKPPLRSEADRAAMVEGVASGTIDVIVSSHDPQAADTKRQTFAQAAFGAVGLETLLPVALGSPSRRPRHLSPCARDDDHGAGAHSGPRQRARSRKARRPISYCSIPTSRLCWMPTISIRARATRRSKAANSRAARR
jgi:hypothetical protein